ncbi:hypothetical protein BRAO375_3660025 [Bradyrhizobium sp. ORS 375]|uniref:DUF669 domain-containing protein n=1 Tax=Bradyrhizobium sp. (strain ORS 375) TaxID=566679 RepID=UPI0002406406|nr:DUF669 domain-containing protein [Bradyrhizobium sp. ORS 375]CCD94631.1 hypothetical protein BRAO375_3660025 [Bradyrhizobium sp. ORS 375]
MAQLNVSLADVNEKDAEGGGGQIIPRDRYLLNIIEGEVKQNSKRTGDLFEYKAEVVEGEFAGVKVFGNINVTHTNPTAQKIGQAQLAALAEATGIGKANLSDTDQLLFQPFYADLDVETYKDRNQNDKERMVVKKFIHAGNANEPPPSKAAANDNTKQTTNAATTPATTPKQTASPAPAPSGGGRQMPWQRSG